MSGGNEGRNAGEGLILVPLDGLELSEGALPYAPDRGRAVAQRRSSCVRRVQPASLLPNSQLHGAGDGHTVCHHVPEAHLV